MLTRKDDVNRVLKVLVFTKGLPEISIGCPLMDDTQRSVVLILNELIDEKFMIRLCRGLGALVTPVISSATLALLKRRSPIVVDKINPLPIKKELTWAKFVTAVVVIVDAEVIVPVLIVPASKVVKIPAEAPTAPAATLPN